MPTAVQKKPAGVKEFAPGLWQKEINVRDFIQQNYEPYEGDESFLAPATERTRNLWTLLRHLFLDEQMPEKRPEVAGPLRGGGEEGLVALVRLVVLLDEVPNVDFLLPQAGSELLHPGRLLLDRGRHGSPHCRPSSERVCR